MLTPEFLEIENKLTRAKCPEVYFGNPDDPAALAQYLLAKARDFKQATNKRALGDLDGNGQNRLERLKRIFTVFYKWAVEKMLAGKYGDMQTFRTRVVYEVKEHDGRKLFCLDGPAGFDIYTEWISAGLFEGYDRMDSIVIREKEKTTSGCVRYYGTHGAREMFWLDPDYAPYLGAEELEIGDRVEIESASYGSIEEYAGLLLRMDFEFPHEAELEMDKIKAKDMNDAQIIHILRETTSLRTFVLVEEEF